MYATYPLHNNVRFSFYQLLLYPATIHSATLVACVY